MIGAIEDGILAVLKVASDDGRLGYDYRTLESFPDEFDAYLNEKGTLRTPGAWAVYLGTDQGDDRGDDAGWQGRSRFALIVAAQNQRNERQTRHGDGREVGSYQLAIDAAQLLTRNALGLDLVAPVAVTDIRPVARSQEMVRQGLSMMALQLECVMPVGRDSDDPGAFDVFHVDWDVPAFGNVHPDRDQSLPAANPDAEDLIEVSS